MKKRVHYNHLKEKWGQKHKEVQKNLWEKHKDALSNLLTAGSLSGLMLLSSPSSSMFLPHFAEASGGKPEFKEIDKIAFLVSDLSRVLPSDVRELSKEEERRISDILSRNFNIRASAELEGKRLNRSYGLIGAEQHLARFPGDTMSTHFDSEEDAQKYWSSGMAPGLGAWRYFANSQQSMTEVERLREKYYIAVQTFLVPDYYNRIREYSDFFKFRKMLVVNPENGNAVVAVIGDSGPSQWTGKHLGGSPEVMKHLERVDGSMKGPVLYFFINDPEDKIPLGPLI